MLSPSDRASEVNAKVQDWLDAGCHAVWVVDPETQTVTVHRGRKAIAVYDTSETLCDEELLPGFALAVQAVF